MKRRLFADSRILRKLGRMTDGLYEAASRSAAGRALTSYDAETRDAERSAIAVKVGKRMRKLDLRRLRLALAAGVEQSRVVCAVNSFLSAAASTMVRSYGAFAFAFGFYGVLMYFLSRYVIDPSDPLPLEYLIAEGAVLLISVPMMAVKKTAAEVICRSRLANAVFFDLLGFRAESVAEKGKGEKRLRFTFIAGMLLGSLTFFVSPLDMIRAAAAVFFGYLILCTPESGLIIAVLVLPFVPTAQLGALMIYVTVCCLLKVMRGKRTLSLDLKDWAILLFGVVILLGGAFSFDPSSSFSYSVKMLFFLFAYILTVNMIRSQKWMRRLKKAIILICVASAAGGLIQALGRVSPNFLSEGFFFDSTITSFFDSERSLAYFLIFGFFFMLSEFLGGINPIRKIFLFILAASAAYCLWLTGFYAAMLAFIIALFIFFMIYSSRTLIALLAGIIIVPAMRFLPVGIFSVFQRITEGVSQHIAQRTALWDSSASMAGDFLLSGAGLGSFRVLFQQYANENVSYAVDSSNLYLQTTVDVGIFGLILFLAVMVLFTQHSFSLFAKYGGKRTVDSVAGFAGVVAILLAGAVDYVWADEKIFLMFWIVTGAAAASGNLTVESERQREHFFELR